MAPQAAQTAGRGAGGPPTLPAGAYHNVNYLVANTTMNGSQIATATDLGSVGGAMSAAAAPETRYQPEAETVNGLQYANFNDVAGDLFRDYLEHSSAPDAWPFGADSDNPFSLGFLFLASAASLAILGTLDPVSASGGGFFARLTSAGELNVGVSPSGLSAWRGLSTSPALSAGWHVALCEWGEGSYAHYVDDAEAPFDSGTYTHGGSGGDPSNSMRHGLNSLHGVTGLGHVVLYPRKTTGAPERRRIFAALRATLELE